MKVALVNPFDPLPGESVREGRYAAFARALAQAGHQVAWFSSDFSHTLKRPREPQAIAEGCRQAGITAHLASAPPYRQNVSLARLRSHAALAGAICRQLDIARQFTGPDAWLQGHALWHILTSLSLGCMYLYYRSEVATSPNSGYRS